MGSLNDIINGKAGKEKKGGMKRSTAVMVPIELLVPNEDNKKSFGDRETRNIDLLAEEMLISGRVLENLVVRKLHGENKYLILSGHRRYYASQKNVQLGHHEFAELPCEVTDESDAKSYYNLLIANLATEPLTEYEKMTSTMHLREVLPELIGDDDLRGRKLRARIAETLHVSQTKVAQYENISNHLVDEAMELFEAQKMNVSTANDLAGLPDDVQQEFVKGGVAPGMADVKTVRSEFKVIRSFDQMGDQEKKEAAFILDRLLLHTELKKYRDEMELMGAACLMEVDRGGADAWEKYAADAADRLLNYGQTREFTERDTDMYLSRGRRVMLSHHNCQSPVEMQFTYGGFFQTFCEVYRENIARRSDRDGQDEPAQMQLEDYDGDDPYGQVIPQPDACDRKCFHCRNTECNCYQMPRDKCIYFDKIDCTITYVFDNLKKDFPDVYEKCVGCCMRCPVADDCKYACRRKDMSIIRERAGIHDAVPSIRQDGQPQPAVSFAIPKEEEILAFKALMSVRNQYRAYLYLKETPAYVADPEKFSGPSGFLDRRMADRTPEGSELKLHPCWIRAEYLGKGIYQACFAYGELTNTQLVQYDVHTVMDSLRRSVAVGYFGDNAELPYVVHTPSAEDVEAFVLSYDQWNVWLRLPEIGVKYYRAILDSGCQVVAVAYENMFGFPPDVLYYYIPLANSLTYGFNGYLVTIAELVDSLTGNR